MTYNVTALMFDENMKLVGERTEPSPFVCLTEGIRSQGTREERYRMFFERGNYLPRPFVKQDTFQVEPWLDNQVGLMDEVWEPFTPIRVTDKGFETLKHRFTLDASGLPAQIEIVPDPRELPLELRAGGTAPDDVLLSIGRGAQFRAPMRLEAVVGGRRVPAKVVTPAKAIRTVKSKLEYASTLEVGSLPAELRIRYDCDGSFRGFHRGCPARQQGCPRGTLPGAPRCDRRYPRSPDGD